MDSSSTNTPNWIEPFRKILELEHSNGSDNRAVVGGLDRFVQHWAGEMTAFLGDPKLAQTLVQSSYAEMSPAERRYWASHWRAALDKTFESIAPGKKSPEGIEPNADTPSAPTVKAPGISQGTSRGGLAPGSPVGNTSEPDNGASNITPPTAGQTIDGAVTQLKRVNDKLAARLSKLEVNTVRDLLYLFPRRHLDYSKRVKIDELTPGQEQTVVGQLWEVREVRLGQKGRLKTTEAVLSDETGNIKITWFGQSYLARSLKPNTRLRVSGKVDVFRGQKVLESPEYEQLYPGQSPAHPGIHTGRLVPVYPLTAGLTGRNLRSLTWQALNEWLGEIEESLPLQALARTGLMPLRTAIRQAHYPDSLASWDQARRRLAFDELLTLQISVLARRQRENRTIEGVAIQSDYAILDRLIQSLPFTLTNAQRACIDEILADLRRGTPPMNRLLQGEVGSGKTVVVLVALLATIAAGFQGAMMVPTEVLAEQHFQTIARLLSGLAHTAQEDNLLTAYPESLGRPVTVGLLTGSIRARPRRKLNGMAAEGTLDLLIGTQALIQDPVDLPRLGLAVMDEQHRFGVMQRSALRQKSLENPHILVMSATPIPRTLALTLYGDLDISTINELPPGRQEILTRWLDPERRNAAYGFIQREIQSGHQAFIVYPLIDESDAIEAKAATEEYQRLSREVFPELRLGLLHGRMPAPEKERAIRRFRDGELDVLVTTAVVEVGIDIPNATVMLIEGADRFGLSQLHQFRGRVGRGEHKSYCILISDAPSGVAQERLSALEQIQDGFQLAEVDLELRGPGDFFGTRQSGLPNLRMAHLSDRQLLDLAREEATRIIESDPTLEQDEHAPLAAQIARFSERAGAEFS